MNIELLSEFAKVPTRGSEYAAGWDLYSAETAVIEPGETFKVHTDVAMEIPMGYFGGIYARSGLATKHGLRPANCCGIVDSDYRGNIVVALHNDSNTSYTVETGERIAQIIIQPYNFNILSLDVVDKLEDTKRGATGFGDSGKF